MTGVIGERPERSALGKQRTSPRRWTVWVLRGSATIHALAAFGQAVLAGRFLSGDYAMLGLHAENASLVGLSGFALLVAALLHWRPGGGPGRVALACLALSAAEVVQIVLGYGRVLGVHVPLGVAIIATAVGVLVWAWGRAGAPVVPGQQPR
jgi:hypothetical protein